MMAIASCEAQIFPFSNLKHFLKGKTSGASDVSTSGSAVQTHRVAAPGSTPTREPLLPTLQTSTTPMPTTTTGSAGAAGRGPYLGPYSIFDDDDDGGYREYVRPDFVDKSSKVPKSSQSGKGSTTSGKQSSPTRLAAKPATDTKQKKRLADNHVAKATPASTATSSVPSWTPSHGRVPLKIAYEPTSTKASGSGDVHVLPSGTSGSSSGTSGTSGDGQLRLYLTPPRLPSNKDDAVRDAVPLASHPRGTHVAQSPDAAPSTASSSPAMPMPPVPASYLRPPSAPSTTQPDAAFFKYGGGDRHSLNSLKPMHSPEDAKGGPRGGPKGFSKGVAKGGSVKGSPERGQLELTDVAIAAVSHSKNPSILKGSNSTPPKLKPSPSSPHNALLQGPQAAPPGESKLTNHKGAGGRPKQHKKGSNHKPAADSEGSGSSLGLSSKGKIPLVESSASSPVGAAALGLGAHRTPANHRPAVVPAVRVPKHKNHRPGPVVAAGPAALGPIKYHNHKPAVLVGQESMANARYRKRPLGPLEQEVAASGLQHAGVHHGAGLSDGDRVEFQMHGQQGPESYKFGYDTGGGHNRQFRYEERDPHGNVKGHYGYVDEHGKLQVVNYKADPHHGYSADVSKLHV